MLAGRWGLSVHDDVALPALALVHVVEHRNAARRLHDAAKAAAEHAAELGQPAAQAAVLQPVVLRPVGAVEARIVDGVVARRHFGKSRRRRRVVFASGAHRLLVLAGIGRLHQREEKFPVGRGGALGFRRLRRQAAVGRIDDHRGARAGMLDGHERRAVGTADIDRGAALLPRIVAEMGGALQVQRLPLRVGEELLVAVAGRTLQRRVEFFRPDALKIRLPPRRFRRRTEEPARRPGCASTEMAPPTAAVMVTVTIRRATTPTTPELSSRRRILSILALSFVAAYRGLNTRTSLGGSLAGVATLPSWSGQVGQLGDAAVLVQSRRPMRCRGASLKA